jgi:hypothetical protein
MSSTINTRRAFVKNTAAGIADRIKNFKYRMSKVFTYHGLTLKIFNHVISGIY